MCVDVSACSGCADHPLGHVWVPGDCFFIAARIWTAHLGLCTSAAAFVAAAWDETPNNV
jgi:hypothetical protein